MGKNERKESLLEAVWHHLFGYRHYAVVSNDAGTMNINLHNRICETREEAMMVLRGCRSFELVEIVSFRSRHRYESVKTGNGMYVNLLRK